MAISAGTYTFGAGGTYATLGAAWADIIALTGDLTLQQVGDSLQPGVSIGGAGFGISLNGHQLLIESLADPGGDPAGGYLTTCQAWSADGRGNGLLGLDKLNVNAVNGVGLTNTLIGPSSGSGNGQFVSGGLFRATGAGFRALSMGNVTSVFSGGATATYSLVNTKMKGLTGGFEFRNGTLGNEPSQRLICENVVAQATDAGAPAFQINTRFNDSLLGFSMRNIVALVNLAGGTAKPVNLTGMNGTIKAAYAALILSSAANGGNLDGVTYPYPAITSPDDIISLSEADADWLSTYGLSALYTNGTAPDLAGNPYNVAPYPIGIPGPYVPPPSGPGSCMMPVFVPGF